jgi:hypothetical protein
LLNGYRFGVNYQSTSEDFLSGAFLTRYHDPQVREQVVQQLGWMAEDGVGVVTTWLWWAADEGVSPSSPGAWNFPPSSQQLANLEQYVQDVGQVGQAGGPSLDLQIGVFYHGCADYGVGSPSGVLGDCGLSVEEYGVRLLDAWTSMLNILGNQYRVDGTPVVSVVYIEGAVKVALDATDPLLALERPNQRWFLETWYPVLSQGVRDAGLIPSLVFLLDPADHEVMNNQYQDPYPGLVQLTQRAGVRWLVRAIQFLKNRNLVVPPRIDLALFPKATFQWSNMGSVIHRLVKDVDFLIPVLAGTTTRYEVAGLAYPSSSADQRVKGAVVREERAIRGAKFNGVNVWTTPCGEDQGEPSGYPWEADPWMVEDIERPFASSNPSMELDEDLDGVPDGWSMGWIQGNVSFWTVSRWSSSTGVHHGTSTLKLDSGPCIGCQFPDGVWVQSEVVSATPGKVSMVRFWEKNAVTPQGTRPPASSFKGVSGFLISMDVFGQETVLDSIALTNGGSAWREHVLAGVVPSNSAGLMLRFGILNPFTTTQSVHFDSIQ